MLPVRRGRPRCALSLAGPHLRKQCELQQQVAPQYLTIRQQMLKHAKSDQICPTQLDQGGSTCTCINTSSSTSSSSQGGSSSSSSGGGGGGGSSSSGSR